METKYNTAKKLIPTGKESWVLEFKHPLIKDSSGKDKKIRKGLGTKDAVIAEGLIQQMNFLLSNESYWPPSARLLANEKFDSGIVNAFYDGIDYVIQDYEKIREKIIPLKTNEDGYSRVLLLGATGAGKTTLLRQLMGTNPEIERFPATSNARTTVFDTEIILSEGNYKGIVTFYTESETRQMIKDSIKKSMAEFLTRKEDAHILRTFLEDKDQRFRLSYIIGKVRENKKLSEFEDDFEETESNINELEISNEEQKEFEIKILKYLSQIKEMTNGITEKDHLKYQYEDNLPDEDKRLLEEIILSDIEDYDEDDLFGLVEEILIDIKDRFKQLNENDIITEKFGWPIYWLKDCSDRSEFLKSIRFFSSNSSTMFGKLLTPLVSGMRVEAPFKPDFLPDIPKLIILDGEGLGHISDTTSNLPFKTIKKFNVSDAIVLVDNSQSSMLAAPYAVIKSVASSGHAQKLFLCFSHFEAVKGDSLPTLASRKEHIFGTVDNLLGKLKAEIDYSVNSYLVKTLHNNSYYLSNLDEKIIEENSKYKFTINQLTKLISDLVKAIPVPIVKNVAPTYDISTLIFKIRKASLEFNNKWNGYLFGSTTIPKQHFTRLKALTLRLGFTGQTEYSNLTPISDFIDKFNIQISNFLQSPLKWNSGLANDEEKQRIIFDINKKISDKIEDYAATNIKNNKIHDWQAAYSFSGKGSANDRAIKIESIYSRTIPIPEEQMTEISKQFLIEIMKIIKDTIEDSGGTVTSIFNS